MSEKGPLHGLELSSFSAFCVFGSREFGAAGVQFSYFVLP